MTEEATVTAKITYAALPGGPNVSPVFGSPIKNPSSTAGPQLDFNEKVEGNYVVAALATVAVNFQTLAKADFVYIGTDQPIDIVFNGGSDNFSLEGSSAADESGGWISMFKTGITQIDITSTAPVAAKVIVILLGD